jgi:polyhydroxybutyrate depolymerase
MRVPLVLLALASALACPGSVRAQATQLSILSVGGVERSYIFHPPAAASGTKVPLLIALHGYTGTARAFQAGTLFDEEADRLGFAVAYPNATGKPQEWNAGGPFEAWTGGADDVLFISSLIDDLARRYPIDTGRVCVAGHSNGAYMAYRLARELPSKIAAIAPVAGSLLGAPYAEPKARAELAILHIHALDDPTVRYGGFYLGAVASLPVEKTIAYWVARQGCDARPIVLLDAGGVVGRRWASASGRGDVRLYTTAAGGHRWPRADAGGLEATELIAEFVASLRTRP